MNKVTKAMIISMIGNIFLVAIKIVGGIFGNSSAVLADGVHSLSDLGTDIFSLIGVKISNKPKDSEHPMGYGKMENIVALVIGVVIIVIGLSVFNNSFKTDVYLMPSKWLAAVVFGCIVVKYFIATYLKKKGKEIDSPILKANGKESMADVLSSLFVFIIIMVSQFSANVEWLGSLDMVGSMVVSLVIVYTGFDIIRRESNDIIGHEDKNIKLDKDIKDILSKNEEYLGIKNIDYIRYGNKFVTVLEIYINEKLSFKKAHEVREKLHRQIKDKIVEINYLVIKMLPKENENARVTRSGDSKKKTSSKTTK